jgi:hypothetical protein
MGDVYVCGNCPLANDANPGTQSRPVATIGRGLVLAERENRSRVLVAARFGMLSHDYAEAVTLFDGRTVEGRWVVSQSGLGLTWMRSGPRTQIRNQTEEGVVFPRGVSAATVFDGFAVEKWATRLGGARRIAGMTVLSSAPVIRDFEVSASAIAVSPPRESVGIDVAGAPTAPASPTLQGTAAIPSAVSPGPGSSSSLALVVREAKVASTFVDYTAGGGDLGNDGLSAGVFLLNGAGSVISGGTLSGGLARNCFGFLSSGTASGVRVEGLSAIGCPRAPNVLQPPAFGVGVLFDGCGPSMVGATPALVRNVSAQGGAVGGTDSSAVGAAALNGCNVRFESQGGTSTFTGSNSSLMFGSQPTTTIGLACSYVGFGNPNGFDARCSVVGVTATGGSAGAANSIGLICDGTCANQNSACRGSCEEVVNNTFFAGTGTQLTHAFFKQSSPAFRQNRLGLGNNASVCQGRSSQVVGLALEGSGATITNNLVFAGSCITSIGVSNVLVARSDGLVPSANFHSNTIVSTVGNSGTPQFTNVGVLLSASSSAATPLVGSVFRNNIIASGQAQTMTTSAFREQSANVDPSELTNNLFFSAAGVLYLDEGSAALSSAAEVNRLPNSLGNLAGNPEFVAAPTNFSLASNSPARNAGTTTAAPPVDLTGASRPNPVNTAPDLGCYEVP